MSSQWGHGNQAGKVEAMRNASIAVKEMQDREVYAMAIVNKMMLTHADKDLVEELHKAIQATVDIRLLYTKGFWYGNQSGMFVGTHAPMRGTAALAMLKAMAAKSEFDAENSSLVGRSGF